MIWGESFQWLWLDPSADGRQDWRATGSTLIVPYYLRLKAEALHTADRTSEALEAIREAEALTDKMARLVLICWCSSI